MTVRISGTNTTAAPGFQGGDSDTGIRPGTNEIEFVTGGSVAATFNSSGNLVFPDGQGIDFSASEGSGASGSILDDYEEGAWTASVRTTNNNQTISVTNTTGYYVKVGRLVTAYYYSAALDIDAVGTGAAVVHGLPFTTANLSQGYCTATVTHATCFSDQVQNGYADPNNDRIVFIREGTTNSTSFIVGDPRYLMFSITYRSE